MTLGGGFDREWLSLQVDDRTDMTSDGVYEDSVGCHVGKWRGLNVLNPQPGYEYVWMLDPGANGNNHSDRALEIQMSGGQIVQNGDAEMAAYQKLVGDQGITEVSGYVSNGEVCLVRVSQEKIREKREEEHTRAQRQIRGKAEEDFVSGASESERIAGHGRPTRFQSFRHSTEFQEGGQTRELHTNSGVTKDQYDPIR